jgi:hypothetical protein
MIQNDHLVTRIYAGLDTNWSSATKRTRPRHSSRQSSTIKGTFELVNKLTNFSIDLHELRNVMQD